MAEEKPGFTVTTNDASDTIIIGETVDAQPAPAKPAKPAKGELSNADTP